MFVLMIRNVDGIPIPNWVLRGTFWGDLLKAMTVGMLGQSPLSENSVQRKINVGNLPEPVTVSYKITKDPYFAKDRDVISVITKIRRHDFNTNGKVRTVFTVISPEEAQRTIKKCDGYMRWPGRTDVERYVEAGCTFNENGEIACQDIQRDLCNFDKDSFPDLYVRFEAHKRACFEALRELGVDGIQEG